MKVANRLMSPSKKAKIALKMRVDALKALFPNNWRVLYLFKFPEEKGQEDYLTNVLHGRSLHEPTIVKMEALLVELQEKKLI